MHRPRGQKVKVTQSIRLLMFSSYLYVFRSSREQDSVPREDDHTYLASAPVATTHELLQPLPFRQNVRSCFMEC